MCLMIILKVTKNQGFTLCLEDTIFEKPHGGCYTVAITNNHAPLQLREKKSLVNIKKAENIMTIIVESIFSLKRN